MNDKIHSEHSNLPADLQIPFIFIDPVVKIFEDQCNLNTRNVTEREKTQFLVYTDK